VQTRKLRKITIGNNSLGEFEPCYLIAEIGINHNGDLDLAKQLIDIAAKSKFNAVKFQKRDPDSCVPEDQREIKRKTPWGEMSYIDYKHKIEFGKDEYQEIDRYCKELNIDWFVSCWDIKSVDFMEAFNPICYKIASSSITDKKLLLKHKETKRPIILSTGMSTLEEIQEAVSTLGQEKLILLHSTSAYPCPYEEVNLKMIDTLKEIFPDTPIGYSGHELGIEVSFAAVAKGACVLERHVTLDQSMWGSDHKASLEPDTMNELVNGVRIVENALGDGIKKVYDSEMNALKRLRKVTK
jgi:N-acetylneuraminate synthase